MTEEQKMKWGGGVGMVGRWGEKGAKVGNFDIESLSIKGLIRLYVLIT